MEVRAAVLRRFKLRFSLGVMAVKF